ncbi:efflux RND transporter permease subunit [Sneathiella litorea]|uniref:Efflux pump membrane transporter n=1 Tax=Sneathiella litorea TaxID=2606216 RepID=A0A6L8W846_9PROT|nr:efflux RND transporter permease subunit [Sneathiella litorea]MZR30684.1 efflux RND transporter permease subunit [Sneathiella litorea]
MAQFFIHRPVFAWVIAIVIMLVGVFSVQSLPVSQYPTVAPTTIRIQATYTGASAQIVANSVTTIIEDGMTGLDGLLYMTSSSTEGNSEISLIFDSSRDSDIAQVEVQNKLKLVEASLPTVVTQRGVSVTKSDSSILMVGALVSTDGSYTSVELGDLFSSRMKDTVQRLEGVGSINVFGSEYAMRIWLNPDKLYQYQLTPKDVTSAVSEQNTNVTVGSLGALPQQRGQQITISLQAQSQLSNVDQFKSILLKTNEDGSSVFLGDVASIEIGSESYSVSSQYNDKASSGFGVNLATGANAVATSARVHEAMDKLQSSLPQGVEVVYPYDTAPFVQESINQVYHTLGEAVLLVFLVILVFLQSWRATIIPTIAVPVVLLGTFGVLEMFGMSINTLTMFALVLAIGLLVDDAIVVVENVERVMEEEGIGPVEATEKSMREISGALVGIVVVLSSVFLPMAFMSGSTGVIYRQFSITIIAAMLLSLLVALVLTPAMCAQLLKPGNGRKKFWPARKFNQYFDGLNNGYMATVGRFVKRPFRMILLVLAIGFGISMIYEELPTSFVPTEDQNVLLATVTLPQNATQPQVAKTLEAMDEYMRQEYAEYVRSTYSVKGRNFNGSGQNMGMMFVRLKSLDERNGMSAANLAMKANQHFSNGRFGQVLFLQPPAIRGLGTTNGFTMYLVDDANTGMDALTQTAIDVTRTAQQEGKAASIRGANATTETSLTINIDQQKAQAFGLSISEINTNLSTVFAGSYVNDFTLNGRLRDVRVQGDASFRMQPSDINSWYVRNSNSEMVPLAAFSKQEWGRVATTIDRYNGVDAISLEGAAAEGMSSGDTMDAMQTIVEDIQQGYNAAWTGLSYQERQAGNQEPMLYILSALVVFLCLAALYESWTIPLSVMLAVPVSILGALIAAKIFGQSNDVYFKVGLLTTIGLAARNAILIVEFAQTLRAQGEKMRDAVLLASRQRLRPIMMTTFAFGFGVLPLAVASGAGANAQNSVGIGLLGGILFSALFGLIMVPVLYIAVIRGSEMLGQRRSKNSTVAAE